MGTYVFYVPQKLFKWIAWMNEKSYFNLYMNFIPYMESILNYNAIKIFFYKNCWKIHGAYELCYYI